MKVFFSSSTQTNKKNEINERLKCGKTMHFRTDCDKRTFIYGWKFYLLFGRSKRIWQQQKCSWQNLNFSPLLQFISWTYFRAFLRRKQWNIPQKTASKFFFLFSIDNQRLRSWKFSAQKFTNSFPTSSSISYFSSPFVLIHAVAKCFWWAAFIFN